ncbi:hypothetical protein [Streptosporangium sp. NBC_01756]|uniref:hypothetical protein n=1 Tax=Streptosporangium sp. NBC_01756 TaxID=2975950 RepID=UPI002DDAD18C|nr:hypothetical protein [Streptosporangium sp. NBC_01756]WSC88255.1 hypothetical protein OIE48_08735 [Streptosporangium sp. NBC_01756]
MNGYHVEREALRRQARVYDELERNARTAYDELRAAFDQDRNTLGNDVYGAELAKDMPGIERGIFDDLKKHIDQLEYVAAGLNVSAHNSEQADQPLIKGG